MISFSISLRIFSVTTALLLVCARIWAVSANDLMRNGDVCDVKLQASEALEFYLSAEKLEPQNTRLLVSIARQYRHLMVDAKNREEKLRLGGVALNYAKRAVAMAPNDSQTQLALAISCGKLLPLQGPKEQTEAAHVIKDAADKAIKLDPQNDLAWHVLGGWHMCSPGAGGSPTRRGGEAPTPAECSPKVWPCRMSKKMILRSSLVRAKLWRNSLSLH